MKKLLIMALSFAFLLTMQAQWPSTQYFNTAIDLAYTGVVSPGANDNKWRSHPTSINGPYTTFAVRSVTPPAPLTQVPVPLNG